MDHNRSVWSLQLFDTSFHARARLGVGDNAHARRAVTVIAGYQTSNKEPTAPTAAGGILPFGFRSTCRVPWRIGDGRKRAMGRTVEGLTGRGAVSIQPSTLR